MHVRKLQCMLPDLVLIIIPASIATRLAIEKTMDYFFESAWIVRGDYANCGCSQKNQTPITSCSLFTTRPYVAM